jgi:hypothetical protein
MEENKTFKPKGAIAFFIVMVCFYLSLWLLFYFILLGRQ